MDGLQILRVWYYGDVRVTLREHSKLSEGERYLINHDVPIVNRRNRSRGQLSDD